MNLQTARTKSGKSYTDFKIRAELIEKDAALIVLIIRSEAMDDAERQYWFNLTEVMNEEQIEKLRIILIREKEKLEAIYKKYGKKMPENPAEANAEAKMKGEERKKAAASLKAQEEMANAEEVVKQEAILDEGAWE